MSMMFGLSGQPMTKTTRHPVNLFNNQALSDVQIKLRDEQRIFGHKQILAQQSEWFFRAFNGNFPVASSNEICLDDEDDDPKAIRALISHIYDPEKTVFDSVPATGLMYHVNLFAAADKYDVPSLRVLVISRFTESLEQTWQTSPEELCTVIQRLCGPNAVRFADASLQKSAASFCSQHITELIKIDAFVNMLEEGEPFAGRLLTAVLKGAADNVVQTFRCQQCRLASDDLVKNNLSRKCIGCSNSYNSGFGSSPLVPYKNFWPI